MEGTCDIQNHGKVDMVSGDGYGLCNQGNGGWLSKYIQNHQNLGIYWLIENRKNGGGTASSFFLKKMSMRDFSKFFFFVKGVIESGTVIKYGDKVLKNDLKLHFNRLMSSSVELERYMQQALGKEVSQAEEDINHMLIGMIWKIFDLENDELDRFLQHINKYEDGSGQSQDKL